MNIEPDPVFKRMAFKEHFSDFCRFSSIRGLSRAVRATNSMLRVLWIIVVLTGGSIATWQVTRHLLAYFSYQTVTAIKVVTKDTEFPDVTVCSLQAFSSRISHEKLRELEREHSRLVQEGAQENPLHAEWMGSGLREYYTNIRAFVQSVSFEILHQLSRPFEEFIVSCRWEGWQSFGLFAERCTFEHFKHIYYPEYGLCFTISLNSTESMLYDPYTVWKLKLILHTDTAFNYSFTNLTVLSGGEPMNGVSAYIHERGTYPDFSTPLRFAPGFSSVIDLDRFIHSFLPVPYGNCTADEYIYLADGTNTKFKYTYEACLGFCLNELLTKSCGCFIPDYPWIKEWLWKYFMCGNLSRIVNEPEGMAIRELLQCVDEVFLRSLNCDCPEPCHSVKHYPTIHQAAWPHLSYQLQFYHKVITNLPQYVKDKFSLYENISLLMEIDPFTATNMLQKEDLIQRNFVELTVQRSSGHVTEIAELPGMSPFGVLGSIGGLLNLWIGVSFVTLFEILELLFHLSKSTVFGVGKRDKVIDISNERETVKQ